MNETCGNDYATIIYPCYFDNSYDIPMFIPNFEMHGNKSVCLENGYD